MSEYLKQAQDFLESTGTTLTVAYLYTAPYFPDDKEKRDIYQFTLQSAKGVYSAKFGDSIRNTERRIFASEPNSTWLAIASMAGISIGGERRARSLGFTIKGTKGRPYLDKQELAEARKRKPTAYDILACLSPNHPLIFSEFCADYGYDEDSRKAEKIFRACGEEVAGLRRVFTPEQLEQLLRD